MHISTTGIFSEQHMEYTDNRGSNSTEPSLTQMTTKALEILKKVQPKLIFNFIFLLIKTVDVLKLETSLTFHISRARMAFY